MMSDQPASSSLTSDLTEIGRDLLVMEISTIASDSITGRKMPWFPHALIDILAKYADWFVTIRNLKVGAILALTKPLTPQSFIELTMSDSAASDTPITNGWRSIEQLRRTAKLVTDDKLMRIVKKDPLDELEKGIALRIRRNCDQLKAIVIRFRAIDAWQPYLLSADGREKADQTRTDTAADTNWTKFRAVDNGLTRTAIAKALETCSSTRGDSAVLDADAATRLRKIWELGTDQVIAQTLVHIDGDLVTRFQRNISEDDRTYYMGVHNQGVQTAVQQWKTLFDAFTKLLGGLADRLFGRTT